MEKFLTILDNDLTETTGKDFIYCQIDLLRNNTPELILQSLLDLDFEFYKNGIQTELKDSDILNMGVSSYLKGCGFTGRIDTKKLDMNNY